MINQARLDAFLRSTVTIKRNSHPDPNATNEVPEQACALELVSWLGDEPWSDRPSCASPVLAAAVRSRNDRIPDDAIRTEMLKALVPVLVGTRGDRKLELARAYAIVDWSVRDRVPALLDALGQFSDAAALRALAGIDSTATANAASVVAQGIRERQRATAYAAADAAYAYAAAYADAAIRSLRERIAGVVTETNRSFVALIQRLAQAEP